jgi:hypothetical protein
MVSESNIDVNTVVIQDKTIEGIHDCVSEMRGDPIRERGRNTNAREPMPGKIYHFKKVPYLDNIELPTGLKIEYPNSSDILEEYGKNHINCVGSYVHKVVRKESVILGIFKENQHLYTAEINVQEKRLIQLRGYHNNSALKEDHEIIEAYIADACNKNNLRPSDVGIVT